jgi:contact-dependent growth inhibition (CDI) system CdiI-like immunity protein
MTMPMLSKSLQDIENVDEGDPSTGDSSLVERCLTLRRVPVGALAPADLRVLLGQKIGVPTLALIALPLVEADPFLTAELYPGDLMLALIRADENYWHDVPDIRRRLVAAAEKAHAIRRRHRELIEQGHPGLDIDANSLREIEPWVAHQDPRTERQKRKAATLFRERWIARGGDDIFATPS